MKAPRLLTRALVTVSMGASARAIRLAAALILGVPVLAAAQTSRVALDAVAAVDGNRGSQVTRKPTAWFDLFGAVRIAGGLDLRVRPVVFRRLNDGQWRGQLYELALRYERPGAIGLRVDAGQFSGPIGLSLLENRPNLNPVVSQHSTLYLPIPRYEAGTPSTTLLGAAYPLGVKVTASGARWDARAAILDSSPIRGRNFFGANKPPRMANFVAGAGITPYIGLRFGVAVGTGNYAARSEVADKTRGDRRARVAQVEGEWAFRYTRIAGEFLWTRRELATMDSRVDGGWIEVMQTLTPRVFVAARYDDQWTEWRSVPDQRDRHEPYRRLESTVGVRLTPDVTVRGSYMTRKGYVVGFWDDQVLASVVFAKRIK